jgi:hypothetical protein
VCVAVEKSNRISILWQRLTGTLLFYFVATHARTSSQHTMSFQSESRKSSLGVGKGRGNSGTRTETRPSFKGAEGMLLLDVGIACFTATGGFGDGAGAGVVDRNCSFACSVRHLSCENRQPKYCRNVFGSGGQRPVIQNLQFLSRALWVELRSIELQNFLPLSRTKACYTGF